MGGGGEGKRKRRAAIVIIFHVFSVKFSTKVLVIIYDVFNFFFFGYSGTLISKTRMS